jgi:hypothetical protein
MSDLHKLALEMRRISERIHEGAQLLAKHPENLSLITGQISDKNMMALLRMEFDRTAERIGRPVARYSILGAGDIGYDMGAVGSMLLGYRHLYGITRTAIEMGCTIDTFDHHTPFSLGWGYVAEGQGLTFGMVETVNIQTELDLGESTEITKPAKELVAETTANIAGMVKSQGAKELEPYAKKLGRGAIKALSAWATAHAEVGAGVDAQWSGTESKALKRGAPQIQNLATLLASKQHGEQVKELNVEGIFMGGYADTRRFKFRGDDGTVYNGKVHHELNGKPKGFPARYLAVIHQLRGKRLATDEDYVENKLMELRPVK